jgi:hypothetical protein
LGTSKDRLREADEVEEEVEERAMTFILQSQDPGKWGRGSWSDAASTIAGRKNQERKMKARLT